MVAIREKLVPPAIASKVTYSGLSRNVGITFHETGNTSAGANAAAHANLQYRGNSRSASWNWQVDDKEAVQSFGNLVRTWHAGSGTAGDGDDTVAIEVCVNSDGNLRQAWLNAIELAIHLRANGVGKGLYQHHDWSRKNCPERLRGGKVPGLTWADVVAAINAGAAPAPTPAQTLTPIPAPVPAPKPNTAPDGALLIAEDGVWGAGTIGRLQEVLKTPIDWSISNQPKGNQKFIRCAGSGWDWTYRPAGSTLIKAMQTVMKRDGQYSGDIDGLAGTGFARGLCIRFNGSPDTKLDMPSLAVKRMQQRLNREARF